MKNFFHNYATSYRKKHILIKKIKNFHILSCIKNRQKVLYATTKIDDFSYTIFIEKQDIMMLLYILIRMEIIKNSYITSTPCRNVKNIFLFGARQK